MAESLKPTLPQMQSNESLASLVASLTPEQKESLLTDLSDEDVQRLEFEWKFWARQDQLPPEESQGGGPWRVWMLLAGRGFGKTRTGAEWVRMMIETKQASRIALVAPTASDCRDVMVLGESGIMGVCPPWDMPTYEPSKRRLTWASGAYAMMFSADEPDRLRGPQHDAAWCDELAAWRRPEAWDMMQFGLRLGADPQCVVTTTPRPTAIIRDLVGNRTTAITRGSTYDNAANLAPAFLESIKKKYEGTRLGRQEIFAEVLEDVPGALWNWEQIDGLRTTDLPDMRRVVVAVDPAVTSGEDADETGIVVAGLGEDEKGYVLADLSMRGSPDEWATAAVHAYRKWKADRIVAEVNQGGDMVEKTIRTVDPAVAYKPVRASRGKVVRAEPVAALYEQSRVLHSGIFDELEKQMCLFTPDLDRKLLGSSPDRVDALVWAFSELMVEPGLDGMIHFYAGEIDRMKGLRDAAN